MKWNECWLMLLIPSKNLFLKDDSIRDYMCTAHLKFNLFVSGWRHYLDILKLCGAKASIVYNFISWRLACEHNFYNPSVFCISIMTAGSLPTCLWECWKVDLCTRLMQETLIRRYTVILPSVNNILPASNRPTRFNFLWIVPHFANERLKVLHGCWSWVFFLLPAADLSSKNLFWPLDSPRNCYLIRSWNRIADEMKWMLADASDSK